MAVAPTRADRVPRLASGAEQLLDGEDEPASRTQRILGSRNHRLERPEIDERVSRDDDVEGAGGVGEVAGQLSLHELVVDIPCPRLRDHSLGQVDAGQAARVLRDERTTEPGPAAGIEHVEALRLDDIRIRQHRCDQSGRSILKLGELRVEARGEAVERSLDVCVRRALRHVATGAGRKHVLCNWVVRLLVQPLVEELHCLVELAEIAVRERQQPAGFGILRAERDHLGEADRGFVRPLLGVQQDAEVVIRVRVLRIDANGGPIRRFGFDDVALGPEDDAEIAVRGGVGRIE